jgi:threonine synthase
LHNRPAYQAESDKTTAYEIAEQLEWHAPDYVIVPAATGTNLFGTWKGFDELQRLGFTTRVPHFLAVQPVGADPLVRVHDRADAIRPFRHGAAERRAPDHPPGHTGHHAYEAVRKSHGTAVAVTDGEIRQALLDLAGREGIYCEPASARHPGRRAEARRAGSPGQWEPRRVHTHEPRAKGRPCHPPVRPANPCRRQS